VIERSRWGRGYAPEAAAVALRYAREELGQDQVISLIRPGNAGSIRVAEKIGERHRGSVELFGEEALLYASP
jgi:RimJ/RimL family protein N-acetyltransferase